MQGSSRKTYGIASALRVGVQAMRQHPIAALVFVAATLSQGALQGLLVWALREVLLVLSDGGGGSYAALAWGALGVFGIWFLRSSSTYVGELVQAHLAYGLEINAMQAVLAKFLTLPVRFFERATQGDLVMAAYQDLRGLRTVTYQLATGVLSLSRLLGLGVVAWLMSPKLAAVGFVALPLGILPAYWLGQRITRAAQRQRDATATLHDGFLQLSTGIRIIKVNRAEQRVLDRARQVGDRLYQAVLRQARSISLARLLLESISGVGLIAVLILGGREVAAGALDWQALLALLVAVIALYAPVLNLLGVYNSIRTVIPNLQRVDDILSAPGEPADIPSARRLLEPPATIELCDVSFAYKDTIVLDSISATFQRGETIGVVGPSGAGKSTMIALMLRLYDPTRGRVLYDGVDLRAIRRADLMDQCAIVLQEPYLFLDTIAANIRFTRPDASMADVVQAARAANIHDEILQMPHGYDTVLGASRDGHGVSVGQKQRICIASALLKNAPILFLDEATSNLDSVSERAVRSAVERLMAGRTTFVIAHRLSTLRAADRILVLDQGRMVGIGTHLELLGSCHAYRDLWESHELADDPLSPASDGRPISQGVSE